MRILGDCYGLTLLDLSGTGCTSRVLRSLTSVHELKTVKLMGNPGIDDSGIEFLKFTRLNFLFLSGTSISDQGLAAYRIWEQSDLRYLELRDTAISGKDWLARTDSDKLIYLDLSNTNLDDRTLNELPRLENLRFLRIQNTDITDKSVWTLLSRLPSLEYLSVSGTRLTTAGLNRILMMPHLRTLVHSLEAETIDNTRPGVDLIRLVVDSEPRVAEKK